MSPEHPWVRVEGLQQDECLRSLTDGRDSSLLPQVKELGECRR